MIGAAPALTHGVGVPFASRMAGEDPSAGYDMMTPSAMESAGLGLLSAGHSRGLRSGGMVGYSTFFSGYDPNRDSGLRSMSLGRLGGQAVSMTARALKQSGMFTGEAANDILRRASHFDELGLGAFAGPDEDLAAKSGMTRQKMLTQAQSTDELSPFQHAGVDRSLNTSVPERQPGRPKGMSGMAKPKLGRYLQQSGRQLDDIAEEAAEFGDKAAISQASKSWAYKAMGWLGGMGYKDGGIQEDYDVVTRAGPDGDEFRALKAGAGSGGKQILSGTAGKIAGNAIKGIAALEMAQLGAKGAAHVVGEGYKAMVETTEQLNRRVGGDDSMSGGYFNRAAQTERQRAIQTLNMNKLNPRRQQMGNEAYYGHR